MIKSIIIAILIICTTNLFSQKEFNCINIINNEYLSDGQFYALTGSSEQSASLRITFVEGFQYKIKICSSNQKDYSIKISDITNKLIYSADCNTFEKIIDISFKSTIDCEIQITPKSDKALFNIFVNFKDSKPKK